MRLSRGGGGWERVETSFWHSQRRSAHAARNSGSSEISTLMLALSRDLLQPFANTSDLTFVVLLVFHTSPNA